MFLQSWSVCPIRGRMQFPRSMGPMLVVMGDVLAQGAFEVPSTSDQRPVQALSPDGAHPAFCARVRIGLDEGAVPLEM